MTGIRIDELNQTATPSVDHEIAAMRAGETVKLAVQQVVDLSVQAVLSNIIQNSGNLSVADRAAAQALTVGDDVEEITILAWDQSVHPFKGRSKYRRQESEPVAYPALSKFQTQDNTWWLLNEKTVFVDMFGAAGDLTYNYQTEGYVRTGGTDDLPAFQAADAFAIASGQGVYYYADDHYLDGQFRPQADCRDSTNHRAKIFVRFTRLESAIWPEGAFGNFTGDIIGQYDTTDKPSNAGHLGNMFVLGEFLTPTAHTRVSNIVADVRVCRAADVAGQQSYPSGMANVVGWVEDCEIRIGTFGKTNVPSNNVIQEHWGGQYDAATLPEGEEDLAVATVLQTYHPVRNKITFTTEFNADTHPMNNVWIGSAEGLNHWGDFTSRNVKKPIIMLVGDNIDAFTIARQQGRIKKGIKIGFAHMTGCDFDPVTEIGEDVVAITSRGTSKFEDAPSQTLPDKKLIRQLLTHMVCDGFHIEASGTDITGIRLFGMYGEIDLGDLWVYGCTKGAVENEGSNATVKYRLLDSDNVVRHEHTKGGHIEVNTSRGDDLNGAESGVSESGYGSDNAAVFVFGETITTDLVSDVAAGDTTIELSPLMNDLPINTPIKIGTQKVFVREFADNGETDVAVTPVQEAVIAGTGNVSIDLRSRVDSFVGAYESSEFGLLIQGSDVYNADLSRVRWTGRYAARLEDNSSLHMIGEFPSSVGRITSTSVYTISVTPGSHVSCVGMRVPSNPRVTKHFQLQRTSASGPWATLTMVGCQIEDVNELASAADSYDQVKLVDCYDFDGNPLPRHIGGSPDWTPEINVGGVTTGITYSTQEGRIDVDGDLVHITAKVVLTSEGGGLPGTVLMGVPIDAVGEEQPLTVIMGNVNFGTNEVPGAYVDGSVIRFLQQGNTDAPSMSQAQLLDTSEIYVTGTYRRR